jgi:hypothetical protein
METVEFYRVVSFMLLFIVQGTHAFDFGDALALILGLVIGFVGIFACIGCYARRKGNR